MENVCFRQPTKVKMLFDRHKTQKRDKENKENLRKPRTVFHPLDELFVEQPAQVAIPAPSWL